MNTEWITAVQAGALKGCHPNTIRQKAYAGLIKTDEQPIRGVDGRNLENGTVFLRADVEKLKLKLTNAGWKKKAKRSRKPGHVNGAASAADRKQVLMQVAEALEKLNETDRAWVLGRVELMLED